MQTISPWPADQQMWQTGDNVSFPGQYLEMTLLDPPETDSEGNAQSPAVASCIAMFRLVLRPAGVYGWTCSLEIYLGVILNNCR